MSNRNRTPYNNMANRGEGNIMDEQRSETTQVVDPEIQDPPKVPDPSGKAKIVEGIAALNIRKDPADDGIIVGVIMKNDVVEIGTKEKGWYQIMKNEKPIGYAKAKFLKEV